MNDASLAAAVGARIRKLRVEQGMSQEQLALLSNVSRAYMGSIERGERRLSVSSAAKIAVALQVELSALFPPLNVLTGAAPDEAVSLEVEALRRGQLQRLRRRKRKARVTQRTTTGLVVSTGSTGSGGNEGMKGMMKVPHESGIVPEIPGGENVVIEPVLDLERQQGEGQALLTSGAAAARLGISTRTLERWAKNGKMPAVFAENERGKVYTLFRTGDIDEALHRARRS